MRLFCWVVLGLFFVLFLGGWVGGGGSICFWCGCFFRGVVLFCFVFCFCFCVFIVVVSRFLYFLAIAMY